MSGIKKQQIKYILIGNIIGYLGGATNYFLFFDINIPPIFNILTSAQIIALAYIIARYRFFEADKIILNVFKKIFSVFFSLGIGYFAYFTLHPSEDDFLYLFLILLSTILAFVFFEALFNSRTFYRLFRIDSMGHFRNVIHAFRDKIVVYTSFSSLQKEIKNVFCKNIGISTANILLLDEKSSTKYPELLKHFTKEKNPLDTDKLEFEQKELKLLNEMSLLGKICFPIFHRENILIGFFILGEKLSQSPYTQEELNLLSGATHTITFSIANIFYNAELQKEVDRRTVQLREKTVALKKAYKQLETLDQSKDTFLSVASHELRTPMTVIKGYSEFLLTEKFGPLNEKQKDFQKKIFTNTQSLLELVNDLLDLSKLEAEKMVFSYENVGIVATLEDDLSNFKILCEQKKIDLQMKVPMKLSTMNFDTDTAKFKRIISNLVSNAYKFTPENGTITVSADIWKEDKQFLLFQVKDSGIGIAPENHEKVFEKFTQVTNYLQKNYNGTGLGLPIVKKMIERFGGKIWIESDVDKGATFLFTLPLRHTEEIEKKGKQRGKKLM